MLIRLQHYAWHSPCCSCSSVRPCFFTSTTLQRSNCFSMGSVIAAFAVNLLSCIGFCLVVYFWKYIYIRGIMGWRYIWFLSFGYSRFFFLIFYNSVCYWAWKTRFEYIHKCLFIMIYYVISHGECLFLSENSDLANSIFLFLRIQALTLCYLSSPRREPHNCALWLTNIDDPLSFHEQITPQIIREKKHRAMQTIVFPWPMLYICIYMSLYSLYMLGP